MYKEKTQGKVPPFLSKWKIRKNKALKDPLVEVRQKARRKTKNLLKEGKLTKNPCVVCGDSDVIAHHEHYDKPGDVIWLCDGHHKRYHDGKIGLFDNQLWWNPNRLVPKRLKGQEPSRKYQEIKKDFNRKKRGRAE